MDDAYSDLSGGGGGDRAGHAGGGAAGRESDVEAEALTLRELVWHADNWNLGLTISRKPAPNPIGDLLADEMRWRIELTSEGDTTGKQVSGKITASGPTVVLAAERLIRQAQRLTVAPLPEPAPGEE